MTTTLTPTLDQAKVEQFSHKVDRRPGRGDVCRPGPQRRPAQALPRLGDSLPVTSAGLAARTGLAEPYVREWLHNQAAAGGRTVALSRNRRS